MKTIIRKGVFETNSSSTHSFMLYNTKTWQCISDDTISCFDANYNYVCKSAHQKPDWYTVEIVSKLQKLCWLFSMIERGYEAQAQWEETKKVLEFEGDGDEDADASDSSFTVDTIMRFLDACIREYCPDTSVSKEEVVEHIREEVGYPKDGKAKRPTEPFYNHCESCFEEGCLIDCSCSFYGFDSLYRGLGLDKNADRLPEYAKEFMSETYALFGLEEWQSMIPLDSRQKI